MSQSYTIEIHHEPGEPVPFWAQVREPEELRGCFFSGHDMAELMAAGAEAIGLILSEPGHEVRIAGLEPEPGTVTEQDVLVTEQRVLARSA